MTREARETTWFPDGKIDATQVTRLASILMEKARELGFTRETYAAAIAQQAEAICGLPDDQDIDSEVRTFVSERLIAAGIALSGGSDDTR